MSLTLYELVLSHDTDVNASPWVWAVKSDLA
jgi:hypothetical protein